MGFLAPEFNLSIFFRPCAASMQNGARRVDNPPHREKPYFPDASAGNSNDEDIAFWPMYNEGGIGGTMPQVRLKTAAPRMETAQENSRALEAREIIPAGTVLDAAAEPCILTFGAREVAVTRSGRQCIVLSAQ